MTYKKVYIDVITHFDKNGTILPLRILWEDGTEYDIDRIIDIRPAASLKAGGCGIRYTCMIKGHKKYIFLENQRWFAEGKAI
ncbi:MAG: hypothetical protein IJB86_09830 [Clostridia bacterium]|nr:hypothetical protein [Clostridia bacterium]